MKETLNKKLDNIEAATSDRYARIILAQTYMGGGGSNYALFSAPEAFFGNWWDSVFVVEHGYHFYLCKLQMSRNKNISVCKILESSCTSPEGIQPAK